MTMAAVLVMTELGVEKRCTRCRMLWPWRDPEFWQRMQGRGGRVKWSSQCRACLAETIAERRLRRRTGARD